MIKLFYDAVRIHALCISNIFQMPRPLSYNQIWGAERYVRIHIYCFVSLKTIVVQTEKKVIILVRGFATPLFLLR